MNQPDLFLASSEGYGLARPRRCKPIKRLRGSIHDDCLLVEVDPPLIGQDLGQGGADITLLVLTPRHREGKLFPEPEFPVYVHVARLRVPYAGQGSISPDELELLAWGELYESEEEAARQVSGVQHLGFPSAVRQAFAFLETRFGFVFGGSESSAFHEAARYESRERWVAIQLDVRDRLVLVDLGCPAGGTRGGRSVELGEILAIRAPTEFRHRVQLSELLESVEVHDRLALAAALVSDHCEDVLTGNDDIIEVVEMARRHPRTWSEPKAPESDG